MGANGIRHAPATSTSAERVRRAPGAPYSPRPRRDELDTLFAAWQVEYDARRAALVAYLDSPRYRRFVEDFEAVGDGPDRRDDVVADARAQQRGEIQQLLSLGGAQWQAQGGQARL